ncbi:MAG: PKD domain-containing protein [Bacteroidetes bacterium]|nr:PKD domain-containing protein [Bacteroidota bacterium]
MPLCIKFFYFFFCSTYVISQSVSFTYNSANGSFCNPATIQFTQNSTGNPVGYIWNFGNNTKSHTANPITTYNRPGSYIVSLTVIYATGIVKISNTIVINQTANPSLPLTKTLFANLVL